MRLRKASFIFINETINKAFNSFSFAKDFATKFTKNFETIFAKINYKKISEIICLFF